MPCAAFAEQLPVPLLRFALDGSVSHANAEAVALAGGPARALDPDVWHGAMHPDDRVGFEQAWTTATTGQTARAFVRLALGGSERPVEVRFVPDGDTGFIDAVLVSAAAPLWTGEAFHQTFLEQSPIGVLHLDAAGVVTFANHHFLQMTGEAEDEVWLGLNVFDVDGVDAQLIDLLTAMLEEAVGFEEHEIVLRRHDGERRTLFVYGSPVHHPDEGLVGGVVMALDVTEQREREETLRVRARYDQAEPALRQAALSSPEQADFLDEAARILGLATLADRAQVLLPVEAGELVTSADWTAQASKPRPIRLAAVDWPLLTEGALLRVTRDQDSEAAQALLTGLDAEQAILVPFLDDEDRIGVVLLGWDALVPPWQRAERLALSQLTGLFETLWAWSRAETRFRQTVDGLDDGLFSFTYAPVLDAGGDGQPGAPIRRYEFVTHQMEALVGLAVEQLTIPLGDGGVNWTHDLVHADDRAVFSAHEAQLRVGRESTLDYRVRRADGAVRWMRERATPAYDAADRLVIGGILADVTEQKQANASILQAKVAAERASQAKTAFMSTMSHEVRTPLGAINGFSELLREEVRELEGHGKVVIPPPVIEFVEVIQENARRALRLVNDLFDLSKLETGALRLQHSPVFFHDITERVAHRARMDLDSKGVAFRWDRDPAQPVVLGDPYRIEQVVEQLLSNAVKFTDAGYVALTTRLDTDAVVCVVEDTGCGIAEEFVSGLFEPFTQEDHRLNRNYDGSGLGLAIVKRLVDAMDGSLAIESEKDAGTRVTLKLPVAVASADVL
ncbi:MAG: ATP-binding protein [Bacteroidota bacterium]